MERRFRVLVSLAALVVILAAMKAAGALLAPVVFGIMVAAISAPGVIWLSRHGMPALFGALLVVLIDIGIVWLFGGLLYVAAGDVERRLPVYMDQLSAFMASLGHSLTRDVRLQCVWGVLRVLRPGGRVIVIERAARGGLVGALLGTARNAPAYEGPVDLLRANGFAAVRQLSEADGVTFVEGVKRA